MTSYPEYVKWADPARVAVTDFTEWLGEERVRLTVSSEDGAPATLSELRVHQLVARYFSINLVALEAERRAIATEHGRRASAATAAAVARAALMNQWVALPHCRNAHYLSLVMHGQSYCGAGGFPCLATTTVAPADMPRCQRCQRSLAYRQKGQTL